METVTVGPVSDAEVVEHVERLVLHHDLIEHHAAAPDAAAGRELALEERDFLSRSREVSSGDQPGRPRADDGRVQLGRLAQLLEEALYYRPRNNDVTDHACTPPNEKDPSCCPHEESRAIARIEGRFPTLALPSSGSRGIVLRPGWATPNDSCVTRTPPPAVAACVRRALHIPYLRPMGQSTTSIVSKGNT